MPTASCYQKLSAVLAPAGFPLGYETRNHYDRQNYRKPYRVIVSFADKRTAAIFAGYVPKKGISSRLAAEALAKMQQLHAATALVDLRSPPGNRLEALKGDRRGQFRPPVPTVLPLDRQ